MEKSEVQQIFWEVFHKAWGEDRGSGERLASYDKKAWMYVQAKIKTYFQEKSRKS